MPGALSPLLTSNISSGLAYFISGSELIKASIFESLGDVMSSAILAVTQRLESSIFFGHTTEDEGARRPGHASVPTGQRPLHAAGLKDGNGSKNLQVLKAVYIYI